MDDYISRQDAIDTISMDGINCHEELVDIWAIERIPAADVVPVVRCWDCRYRVAFDKCCHPDGLLCAKANNFCNYGKRRE